MTFCVHSLHSLVHSQYTLKIHYITIFFPPFITTLSLGEASCEFSKLVQSKKLCTISTENVKIMCKKAGCLSWSIFGCNVVQLKKIFSLNYAATNISISFDQRYLSRALLVPLSSFKMPSVYLSAV